MGEGGACRRMRQNTTVGLWRRRSRQNSVLIICDKSDVGNENLIFFLFFLSLKNLFAVCFIYG
ncbi:MAG: hypothetical protein IJU52_07855, partial [Clostridia bacterium]|nr:hypothetical protein [Clostridia bacterium]